jgi:CopG family nickel-responsive transcriptional regulator
MNTAERARRVTGATAGIPQCAAGWGRALKEYGPGGLRQMKKSKPAKRARETEEADLIRFGISIPEDLLNAFDTLLSERDSQNRSKAICDLIRERLMQESWTQGKGEHVATLTVVFDNRSAEFQRRYLEAKRAFGPHLVSTLHTPLKPSHDMEVLALRGPSASLRAQAEALLALKGILHGKLVATAAEL